MVAIKHCNVLLYFCFIFAFDFPFCDSSLPWITTKPSNSYLEDIVLTGREITHQAPSFFFFFFSFFFFFFFKLAILHERYKSPCHSVGIECTSPSIAKPLKALLTFAALFNVCNVPSRTWQCGAGFPPSKSIYQRYGALGATY
jgi:hypothetical protein